MTNYTTIYNYSDSNAKGIYKSTFTCVEPWLYAVQGDGYESSRPRPQTSCLVWGASHQGSVGRHGRPRFHAGPSTILGEHLYDDLTKGCDVKYIAYCLSALAQLRDWPCNILVIGNGDEDVLNQVTGYQLGPFDWWGRAERDRLCLE